VKIVTDDTIATERTKELAERNFYGEFIALRDQQRANRETAQAVIRYKEIPWELNPQGYMRWYFAPTMTDVALSSYIMYVQRIPAGSRSGKQLTMGGQLGFIWKGGPGYSVIDGERFDWDHWDLLQIPMRTQGSVVQHFNDSDDDIAIMFCSANDAHALSIDKGPGFEQVEECPEYREQQRAARRSG
jgi:hypothetical protein